MKNFSIPLVVRAVGIRNFTIPLLNIVNTTRQFSIPLVTMVAAPRNFTIPLVSEVKALPIERFSLVITGVNDGLPDHELIFNYLNATIYDQGVSFFTCNGPDRLADQEAYDARPNGEVIVYQNNAEVFKFNPSSYVPSVGNNSTSFTLRGEVTNTYSNPKTVELENVSSITLNSNDKHVIVAHGLLDVNPNDTVSYRGFDYEVAYTRVTLNTDDGFVLTVIEK